MPTAKVAPSVGEVLVNRFLKPNGITQYRLAKAIGKSQTTISRIISQDYGLSPEMAKLLGAAFGTGADYWMEVDAKHKLSTLPDAEEVEPLLGDGDDGSIVESGGYTFSMRTLSDATLGRSLRGVIIAAGEIDPREREMLLQSVNEYVMYGILSVPGTEDHFDYKEDMPVNAMALYLQFLIASGEDADTVKNLVHDKRVEVYQEAGVTDIDGDDFAINRRAIKKTDIMNVGALMCASRDLSDDARNEILDCLFSYAHDEIIYFPDDPDAADVFENFLSRCEGWKRAKDLRALYDEHIKNNPENRPGNSIQLEL